jgi:hypothetical protein
MKKNLLKIVLMATAVFVAFGCVTTILANAEEEQESVVESVESVEMDNVSTEEEAGENQANIVEETDTSKWFDETIKPMLIQYGAGVLAFATAVLILLKDFNKIKATLATALGALTKSNEDNISTAQAVTVLKEILTEALEQNRAEYEKRMQELSESLADKVVDIDEVVHKLLDVEMLAYGDNSKLVSNGTAKRIAEVVNNGKIKNQE